MSIRADAANEGITRSQTGGLPVVNGPITLIWWAYFESFRAASWETMASLGPTTFTGTNYWSHAKSANDGNLKNGIDGVDTGTFVPSVGTWYAQAFRRFLDGATFRNRVYFNLPSTTAFADNDTASTLTITLGATHSMEFLTNPWAGTGEWLNGRIAGIKIFEANLTEAQIIQEATRPELVNLGLTPWALIPCPTAGDLTDHSGNGRDFVSKSGGLTTAAEPPYTPLAAASASYHSMFKRRRGR